MITRVSSGQVLLPNAIFPHGILCTTRACQYKIFHEVYNYEGLYVQVNLLNQQYTRSLYSVHSNPASAPLFLSNQWVWNVRRGMTSLDASKQLCRSYKSPYTVCSSRSRRNCCIFSIAVDELLVMTGYIDGQSETSPLLISYHSIGIP